MLAAMGQEDPEMMEQILAEMMKDPALAEVRNVFHRTLFSKVLECFKVRELCEASWNAPNVWKISIIPNFWGPTTLTSKFFNYLTKYFGSRKTRNTNHV